MGGDQLISTYMQVYSLRTYIRAPHSLLPVWPFPIHTFEYGLFHHMELILKGYACITGVLFQVARSISNVVKHIVVMHFLEFDFQSSCR